MSSLVWLITGCSSGFGLEFVHKLLSQGDRVIATGRDLSKMSALGNSGAHLLQLDICASQDKLDLIVKNAIAVYGHIDVLVNNAGYVVVGTLEDTFHEAWLAQYNTNVFGTINITRSVLPHFRTRRSGTIVFIGSCGGWAGAALAGPYCSSKFAIEGIAESVQAETSPFGITTLLVEPGYFRTGLISSEKSKPVVTEFDDYKTMAKTFSESQAAYNGKQPGDPGKGASVIIDVVKQQGVAAGRAIPIRLALGNDALTIIRNKCNETLKLLNEWEDVCSVTNFSS